MRKAEFLALRLFCFLLRRFSFEGVQRISRFIADFTFYVLRVRRRVAEHNLRNAFPGKSPRWIRTIARRSQHNLFLSMFEFLYSENMSPDDLSRYFSIVNPEVFHDALKRNRGVILMTGHFGNWELLATFTMVDLGNTGVIIVKKQRNHFVDRFINDLRTKHTNRVVYMKESVREILKTLGANGIVAMIADQSAPRDSVYVPFFGMETATYAGPALFALRTGAPILMVVSIRGSDGTYQAVLEEVPTGDLSEPTRENIKELTARHTAVLEKFIKEHPDQWLWQHKRWKHVKSDASGNGYYK